MQCNCTIGYFLLVLSVPTNKNALIRYKTLDKCFRNPGRKYFIDDLIHECNLAVTQGNAEVRGISRRQIFDDIYFMESEAGWYIDLVKYREGKKVFYRYRDLSFSINNMPLNELEINQLKSATEILIQFKGMPQFEWIEELVPKLNLQSKLGSGPASKVIEFDSNVYLKGIEYVGSLYQAIIYKKVLSITYHPFESAKAVEFVFHPFYLKQYNNRWFVFGFNPEAKKYDWNLALDRIAAMSEHPGTYMANDTIDWNEYFEDMIGVTRPEGATAEKIELQFYGKTCMYIISKPLHGSQKTRWISPSCLQVELHVILNYELERLILSYADSVKVLSPEPLKRIIKDRLQQAISLQ